MSDVYPISLGNVIGAMNGNSTNTGTPDDQVDKFTYIKKNIPFDGVIRLARKPDGELYLQMRVSYIDDNDFTIYRWETIPTVNIDEKGNLI